MVGWLAPDLVTAYGWRGAFVAFGLRVFAWRGILVQLAGDFGTGKVVVHTRGLTSGGRLAASKLIWGSAAGLEAAWSPWAGTPLALEVGASTGRLSPRTKELVADGYTPFESSFSISRLRAGVALRGSRP